jgi:hypothetical protein
MDAGRQSAAQFAVNRSKASYRAAWDAGDAGLIGGVSIGAKVG